MENSPRGIPHGDYQIFIAIDVVTTGWKCLHDNENRFFIDNFINSPPTCDLN